MTRADNPQTKLDLCLKKLALPVASQLIGRKFCFVRGTGPDPDFNTLNLHFKIDVLYGVVGNILYTQKGRARDQEELCIFPASPADYGFPGKMLYLSWTNVLAGDTGCLLGFVGSMIAANGNSKEDCAFIRGTFQLVD